MAPHVFDRHEQARVIGGLQHVFEPPRLVLFGPGLTGRDESEAQPKGIVRFGIGGEVGPAADLPPQRVGRVALQVHERVLAREPEGEPRER